VKVGRIYQNISPLFSFIDKNFIPKHIDIETNIPKIFLIAPPRSGSTLTYQILTSAFNNFHLTNLWNLLFATPYLGGIISSKRIMNKPLSSFESNYGFVSGIDGEAEGLKFWSYWLGQGLEEGKSSTDLIKIKRINSVLNLLGNKFNAPFISGYLGHSLCIPEIRKYFGNTIFVFLQRDFLANALSLYKASPEHSFSIKTLEMKKASNRMEEIVIQLKGIYGKMIENKDIDTFIYSYEELCESPAIFIQKFKEFASKKGIFLDLKKHIKMPEKFPYKILYAQDPILQKLKEYIQIHELENYRLI